MSGFGYEIESDTIWSTDTGKTKIYVNRHKVLNIAYSRLYYRQHQQPLITQSISQISRLIFQSFSRKIPSASLSYHPKMRFESFKFSWFLGLSSVNIDTILCMFKYDVLRH